MPTKAKEAEEIKEAKKLAKYIEKFYQAVMKEKPEIKIAAGAQESETEVKVHEKGFIIFPKALHKRLEEISKKNKFPKEDILIWLVLRRVTTIYIYKIISNEISIDLLNKEKVESWVDKYSFFISIYAYAEFQELKEKGFEKDKIFEIIGKEINTEIEKHIKENKESIKEFLRNFGNLLRK